VNDLEFLHRNFDQELLIGESPFIKQSIAAIKHIEDLVLIIGNNGVGKSRMARAIYELRGRDLEFLEIDDYYFLPDDLDGVFLYINNFDWIAAGKVLSLIQNRRRNFLMVISSLKDPGSEISGRFQCIRVPDLKDRPEDIIPLATYFAGDVEIDEEVKQLLRDYSWPGNIRELAHVIDQMLTIGERRLTKEHIPVSLLRPYCPMLKKGFDLKMELANIEKLLILQALKNTRGNKNKAAKLLNINRTTLVEKIKRQHLFLSN
jgi:DNA-binding NtrC family response regulator